MFKARLANKNLVRRIILSRSNLAQKIYKPDELYLSPLILSKDRAKGGLVSAVTPSRMAQ